MKKKPSAVAIVIAVIMSIILFLPIVVSGVVAGSIFSAQSILQPGREHELYQSFEKNGGVDYIYDFLIDEVGEEMEFMEGISINFREFCSKEDVEEIVKGIYEAFFKGELYEATLDSQEAYLKDKADEYFEKNIEDFVKEEFGDLYEMATESQIQEAKDEARKIYDEEVSAVIEEEINFLEDKLSSILDSVYETDEYQEFMVTLDEFGYRLDNRAGMCEDIALVGNIFLGIGVILIVLLLLCHLFRPAGFVTAGIFSLLTGGLLKALAVLAPAAVNSLAMEEFLEGEPVHEFVEVLVSDILSWCMEGFHKVGILALGLGAVLVLVGILVFVVRRNKAEA